VRRTQGRVANFVETEQLIEQASPKGTILSSFVQVRGSIPLMWSQIPNIKYKPTTRIAPPETFAKAFDRHVTDLLDIYKVQHLLADSKAGIAGSVQCVVCLQEQSPCNICGNTSRDACAE